MIKICIVSPYSYKLFHPENETANSFGGAEVQQYLLGKELIRDSNFGVCVLVGNFSKEQSFYEEVNFSQHVISLIKSVNCGKRRLIGDFFLDFWRLYTGMKRASADIIIIRGGGSLAGKAAIIAKIILRKKFIYSSAHDRESDGNYFKRHSLPTNILFFCALHLSDAIVCQHRSQQIALKRNLKIDAKIIRTMYPFIKNRSTPSLDLRNIILWVGRLVDFKQPLLFVKLAKYFPEESFLIITNSNATEFSKTIDAVPNLKIFYGIPLEKMDDYFEKTKIFINTSTQEGFPNTFVQAAKNGTPISTLSVNPDGIIEEHGLGSCAYGKFDTLVENVGEILRDSVKWQTMSQNAREYAQQYHALDSVITDYKKLFTNMTTRPCG